MSRLGDFVTLPVEERAAERRKEVDELLAVVGAQKQKRRNWRWMDGFAEDVDVAQIRFDATARWSGPRCSSGLAARSRRGCPRPPDLVPHGACAAGRTQPLGAKSRPEGSEDVRRAASGEPRRARVGSSRRSQPRGRDGSRRRRGARAVEARVHASRHGRGARHPARRGARGDREADAEPAISTRSPCSRSSSARRAATRPRCWIR